MQLINGYNSSFHLQIYIFCVHYYIFTTNNYAFLTFTLVWPFR